MGSRRDILARTPSYRDARKRRTVRNLLGKINTLNHLVSARSNRALDSGIGVGSDSRSENPVSGAQENQPRRRR